MSKVVSQLLWVCIATLCDWLKNLGPLPRPIREEKPKPIVTYSHAFSRAWHGRHVFASSSDWFIGLFTTVVIGQSNYFGFGFTTLKRKPLSISNARNSDSSGFPNTEKWIEKKGAAECSIESEEKKSPKSLLINIGFPNHPHAYDFFLFTLHTIQYSTAQYNTICVFVVPYSPKGSIGLLTIKDKH